MVRCRRFRVAEHLRLAALIASDKPTLFEADSPLPDPFDGLVSGDSPVLTVHDCMGCPLLIDGKPWGLLTLDAMAEGHFANIDPRDVQTFAGLAAATVSAAERILGLAHALEEQRTRADSYRDAQAPHALLGRSPAFVQMLADLRVVADSDLTVLIKGETGTGKELVAKAIQAASARSDKPLITINCAALPETPVESELFGHVRGAFSGATADRRGKFELAKPRVLSLDVASLGLESSTPDDKASTPPASIVDERGPTRSLRESVEAFERRLIEDRLRRNDGNWVATARELDVDRANLNRAARRLGLKPTAPPRRAARVI